MKRYYELIAIIVAAVLAVGVYNAAVAHLHLTPVESFLGAAAGAVAILVINAIRRRVERRLLAQCEEARR